MPTPQPYVQFPGTAREARLHWLIGFEGDG